MGTTANYVPLTVPYAKKAISSTTANAFHNVQQDPTQTPQPKTAYHAILNAKTAPMTFPAYPANPTHTYSKETASTNAPQDTTPPHLPINVCNATVSVGNVLVLLITVSAAKMGMS